MTTTPTPPSRPPFAWQDKRILRRIREQVEEYGSAIAVYTALTVVASDQAAESFQTTHAWLATLSGLCARTVQSRLADLERIGAVKIDRPALKAPASYTLLSAIGNGCRTISNGCRTFGNGEAVSLPTSEEQKNRRRNTLPSKPLTGWESVRLEKNKTYLETEVKKLEDQTYYKEDRTPAKMQKLASLRAQLENVNHQLFGGAA